VNITGVLFAAGVLAVLLVATIFAQGLWVRHHTPRLPEPPGPRDGRIGSDPPRLALLVCGESPAAGVGVDHQSRALATRLAESLADQLQESVRWFCVARNGLRIHEISELLDHQPAAASIVVVAIGVNDAKALVSADRWRQQLMQLTDDLERRFPGAFLVFSGLPDMGRFPALPWPLAGILGWRSRVLDHQLAQFCAGRPNCLYHPVNVRDSMDFADDGFHPGPNGVAAWSGELARVIAASAPAQLERS
jgi:hypothetical protein